VAVQKVRQGDPLRIRAADWNTLADLANARRASELAGGAGKTGKYQFGPTIVHVKNASGYDVGRLGVLGIHSAPAIAPDNTGGDADDVFTATPILTGTTPHQDYDRGRFAIAIEPIANGSVGRACISGLCPAMIDYRKANHHCADITHANSGYLTSCEQSPAQIIWVSADPGGGEPVLGLIRLGADQSSRVYWAKLTADWQANATWVAGNPCDSSGGNVDTDTTLTLHIEGWGAPVTPDYASLHKDAIVPYVPWKPGHGILIQPTLGGAFDLAPELSYPDSQLTPKTDGWDRTGQDGLWGVKLWVYTRIFSHVNGDGDTELYAFRRQLQFDHVGHLRYVSEEEGGSILTVPGS